MRKVTARFLLGFGVLAGWALPRIAFAGAVIYPFSSAHPRGSTAQRSRSTYNDSAIYGFSRVPRFDFQMDVQNPLAASLFVRGLYARAELQRHPFSPLERERFLASMHVTDEQIAALKPIFRLAYAAPRDLLFQPVSDQDVLQIVETFQPKPADWLKVTGARLLPIISRLWQLAPNSYAPPNEPPNSWARVFAQLENQISRDSIGLEWLIPARFATSPEQNDELILFTRNALDPANPRFIINAKNYISLCERLNGDRQALLAKIILEQIPHAYAKSKRNLPYDPMYLSNGQPLIEFYLSHTPSEEMRADFLLMVLSQTEKELAASRMPSVGQFADWLVQVVAPVLQSNEQFRNSIRKNLLNVPQYDSMPDLIARLRLYDPLRSFLAAAPSEEKLLYDLYVEVWSESPNAWTRASTSSILQRYLENRSTAENVGQVWGWMGKILAGAPASSEANLLQAKLLSYLLQYWSRYEAGDQQRKNLIELVRTYARGKWFGKIDEFQSVLLSVLRQQFSPVNDVAGIVQLFGEIQVPIPEDRKSIETSFVELKLFFAGLKEVAGGNPILLSAFGRSYAANAARAIKGAMMRTTVALSYDHAAQAIEDARDGVSPAAALILDIQTILPAAEYRKFLEDEVATAGPSWSTAKGFIATVKYRKMKREYVSKLYETLYDELTRATRPQLKVLRGGSCNRLLEKTPADTVSLQK